MLRNKIHESVCGIVQDPEWDPETRALSECECLNLASVTDIPALLPVAARLRDAGFGQLVTYSRKVFIPLTQLCRDVCHYCTYAQTPKRLIKPYLGVDEVLATVHRAKQHGCKEALFTLGDKPEARYPVALEALNATGFDTTIEYLAHVAGRVFDETGVLPHINAGCLNAREFAMLRPVSASMGMMLESVSERLCGKGMPHYGSPDKHPALRLDTIRLAGESRIPFTTGILIGIGETRIERIESLLAIRALHQRYGHIQEIIIQNFRAKPGTLMARAIEPDVDDLVWTLVMARLIFGQHMSIQVPPNLNPAVLGKLVAAGINDWGGVSPVTPDFVNPEAPWPHLTRLSSETALAGKILQERLTIYPTFILDGHRWMDTRVYGDVLRKVDAHGLPRTDDWMPGALLSPPPEILQQLATPATAVAPDLAAIVAKAEAGNRLDEQEVVRLFAARGSEFSYVCRAADRIRHEVNGDRVSYVVNRNINYTNVCYFKCSFCSFSKGKMSADLRGRPYDLAPEEIERRVREAWNRGATEVCMQGGIHPDYDGQTYLNILKVVKHAAPGMHVHAFSPLEVWHGASTLGVDLHSFLLQLKAAGLGTLPGTAAEILDDEVRAVLCPDKINTEQWLQVMEAAHRAGFRTTATIMFGHVEQPVHQARHLLRIRDLQARTGGFTEFVPLPFVAMEAPLYLKGKARRGPTFRESVLMHAVARIVLHPLIPNIQASWVKLGAAGLRACLAAGVNDLGGTLMNESITRAAGAMHGQEISPASMDALIRDCDRYPYQRTTLYGAAATERVELSYRAAPLEIIMNTPLRKQGSEACGDRSTPLQIAVSS